MDRIFRPADILIPRKGVDMTKWSVIACDQYTSDPEYWADVEKTVGNAPSSLNITLPEIYLGDRDNERIDRINKTMKEYCVEGVFDTFTDSFIFAERTLSDGSVRKGLIGALDLNAYDFAKGSGSPVRATEGTVLSRIPPRVKIRRDASVELPHIMILIDDREQTVIEPLCSAVADPDKLYDFTLMKNGGKLKGWRIKGDSPAAVSIEKALDRLGSREKFNELYGLPDKPVLLFAVGDGNHSLATAKTCYEEAKAEGKPSDGLALVEIVNLHDPSLRFEPIHRLLFGAEPAATVEAVKAYFKDAEISEAEAPLPEEGSFFILSGEKTLNIKIKHPTSSLSVGCLQEFLDKFTAEVGGTVDYIHGEDTVRNHVAKGATGFLLPKPDKKLLFRTVIVDGALPRKTFSMGHADDKRFYLEGRKLR